MAESEPSRPRSEAAERAASSSLPLNLLLDDYNPAARGAEHRSAARTAPRNSGDPAAVKRPVLASPQDSGAPPGEDEPELDLEVHWGEELADSRWREARALSLAVHAVLIVILMLQPHIVPAGPDLEEAWNRKNVTLLAPPEDFLRELTQTAPNEGPITQQFQGAPEEAVPLVAPRKQAIPGPPDIELEPQQPAPAMLGEIEEPKIEPPPSPDKAEEKSERQRRAARSPSPGELRRGTRSGRRSGPTEIPVPERPSSQPSLEVEDQKATAPGREGSAQLGSLALNAPPGQIIEGAIQELSKRNNPGRQAVGDDYGTGGAGGYLPPSPGNAGSNLELLSDPQGVDFRPYLIQVLASVRRNWYAVIPESARLGFSRGKVTIQFAIVRDGAVSKLVIANSSGVQPLDRAAVAGISASNPFPPLPTEYPGSDVRLQFHFLYNLKSR